MESKNILKGLKLSAMTCIMVTAMLLSQGCAEQQYCCVKVPDVPPPVAKLSKKPRVALVLSSGGFRGVAHIGVLEVLEENNVPVDLIVGSSAGSFIGAFYADNPSAAALKTKLMHAKYENFIDTSILNTLRAPFAPTGIVRGRALQDFMFNHMRARDFSELKIPLVVVTTSLLNNHLEILQSGPIIPAVHASSALPPFFAPVKIYQNYYVDGAVVAPVPVRVAREYQPDLVIAVDISKKPSMSDLNNTYQITRRAMDISFNELALHQAREADIVIRPEIIGYGIFEDQYNNEFYEAGRKAALAQLDEIKQALLKIQN
jgi:NTE family protein